MTELNNVKHNDTNNLINLFIYFSVILCFCCAALLLAVCGVVYDVVLKAVSES